MAEILDPLPELVDALGMPLRQESVGVFANVAPEGPPPDLRELLGWMRAVKLRWPNPIVDRVAPTRFLPVKLEDGSLLHGHLDEQERTLFVSPEVFKRLRAEVPEHPALAQLSAAEGRRA